jgi:hypothetical protein
VLANRRLATLLFALFDVALIGEDRLTGHVGQQEWLTRG